LLRNNLAKCLVRLTIILACAYFHNNSLAAQSWSNGYAFRRTVTINCAQVANTDQANFPVLVSGTFPDLAGTANGGSVTSANGFDIIFTSDPNGANVLPFEQESYSTTTGAIIYWVQIPTVSHTTNTVFYLFYGNSSVSTDQSNKPGVWDSNFMGVWHLANGTTLSAVDSTANGNNGSLVDNPSAVAGQIDGAAGLDGSSEYIRVPGGASLEPTSITLSGWVYLTSNTSCSHLFSLDYSANGSWSSPYNSYSLGFCGNTNDPSANMAINGGFQYAALDGSLALNTWHYLVTTYDGSTLRLFVDGVDSADTAASGSITYNTAEDLALGQRSPYSSGEYLPGNLDELRISAIARSADWITTEYNDQKSPSIFSIIGSAGSGPNSPFITILSPSSASQGASLTIQGGNFGAAQGNSTVSFNGATLVPQTWSNTAIGVTVPYGVSSGSFVVTVNGQTMVSPFFTVLPLPSGWLDTDIGAVGLAGSAAYSNGTFTVNASGTDVWGNADQCHFVYQSLSGDGTIVARVVGIQNGGWYEKAGVMIRETLDTGATEVDTTQFQSNWVQMLWRATTNGSTNATQSTNNDSLPYWVMLARSGNNFSSYMSLDGINWVQVGSTQTVTMAQNVYIGLTADSNNNSALAIATFDNVSVTSTAIPVPTITSISPTTGTAGTQVVMTGSNFGSSQGGSVVLLNGLPMTVSAWASNSITVTVPQGATSGALGVLVAPTMDNSNAVEFAVTSNPLPPGWSDEDIGAVGVIGSATYSNGTFTINGSGTDIWGTSDEFHFVYQPLNGDGMIVARVVGEQDTAQYTKTGVMIRETLNSASTNVHMFYYPGNAALQERTSTGVSASQVAAASGGLSLPYWVKLVRSGNNFSGYMSPDGVSWAQVGSTQTVSMAQNVYIGLTTDANNNSVLATATFDSVAVSSTLTQGPVISSISPVGAPVGAQVTLTGFNFGSSQGNSVVLLNGAATPVNSWSSSSITITIPAGATSGSLVVSVAPGMDDSNAVLFTVASNLLPGAWLDRDVGAVGTAGTASYANSVFTVQGAGDGIGNGQDADGYNLAFQPLTGDGSITARILGFQGSGYSTVGVMLTETPSPDSAFAFESGCFWYRPATGATANDNCTGYNATFPYWVRLSRVGDTVSGFASADGFNWTLIGSQTIPMAQTVYVGMAVTSTSTSSLTSATFDSVSVDSASVSVPIITGLSATTASVGTQVVMTGTSFGASQNGSLVTLNDVPMTINFWSDTSITFTVPAGTTTGLLMVSLAPSMNNSNPVEFEVTTQPLPTTWLDQDIGPVGTTGSASFGNSVFTVQGAGYGLNGTSDSLHFAYQALTGDGSITARVVSIHGTTTGVEAGVMIRETLDPASTFAYTGLVPYSQSSCFWYRATTGATANTNCQSGGAPPYWVMLVRSGSTFTSFVSQNGLNWTQIGTQTITMAQTVYIGLAVSNTYFTPVATATFDGVSLNSSNNPAPIITGVSATTGTVGGSVSIIGTGFGASSLGGSTVILNDVPTTINSWSDTSISITIPAGATSGNLEVSIAPTMNDSNPVVFTVTSQALPTGWLDADVGANPTPGSATYASGTFTVNSSGAGATGTADGFHFVYQPLVGDGVLVAEVTGMTGGDVSQAQLGVMIRESLNSEATNAFVYFYPYSAGTTFSVRTTTGGSTTSQGLDFGNPTYPYWVKIARTGNLFDAYISQDGVNWTPVGTSQTINMAQAAYIGLAAASPPWSALLTATFNGPSITLGTIPIVSSVSPGSGGIGTSVTITGLNFGSSQGTSTINFGGVPATSIVSWSNNQIVANVPSGGASGPVTAVVDSVPSNNNVLFTLYNPIIASISPSTGQVGGTVTISGTGFGAPLNLGVTSQVYFNGVPAYYIASWSDTSITVWVPNTTSGTVQVLEGGVFSNGVPFDVEPLSISMISPIAAATGDLVTIFGTGFGSSQANSTVSFYGTIASVQSWSDTQIVAYVPQGTVTGPISVSVASIVWYGPTFTVLNPVSTTDSNNNQSTYNLAMIGGQWLPRQVQGSGCSTCTVRGNLGFTYDQRGNMLSRTDENGNTSTYTYDDYGDVSTATVPISPGVTATTTYLYNVWGEVTTIIDPMGFVTTKGYDQLGNLLSVATPAPMNGGAASVTQFAYNSLGELTQITDPNGNSTLLTYTATGLVQTITDAQGNVTTYGYDIRGNRTSVTDANNKQTTFTYDAMSRLTQITYPDSTTTQFAYDYRGRRTSVTDQNGKTTSYAYDDADRPISVTDAAGNVTSYGYDTESNLTSITDANQNTTHFAYDAFGRVIQTMFPTGSVETYGYDNVGNLTDKIDRKNQQITYTYDQLNRLVQKSYPDTSTVNYSYDNDSRLTQVVDPTGTYQFTFDNMGRMTGTSTQYVFLTSRTFTMGYSYDAASNRVGFADPEGGNSTYTYDTLNRLQTLAPPTTFTTGAANSSFGFAYDALSRRTSLTRPNGVNTSYSYDNLSHLLSVTHALGGTAIDGASYTLDSAGNRTAKSDLYAGVTTNYGYDGIYELLSATQAATATESYTYDPVGNRLSGIAGSGWNYNTSNELTSRPGSTNVYDANGNTTSKTDSSGTTTYSWDFENRLASVILPGSGGTVSYAYDPFWRRIYKSSSYGTSIYVYDINNLAEETNASGAPVARYTQAENIDEPLAMLRSGTPSYYEQDGLGSTTSLSNAVGAVVQAYTFDSFGSTTASTGSLTNLFQYAGRELDSETMLYFMRARYFDPASGRFISEDPVTFLGGQNFYHYVGNNPIIFADPSGLAKICKVPPVGPHTKLPSPITTCAGQPLINCLVQTESNGNPNARSPKGATGLTQMTPLGVQDLAQHGFDTGNMTNLQLGTTYINFLLTYCSNVSTALAAYNAGWPSVNKAGGIPNNSETQNYVKRINTCLENSGIKQGVNDPGVVCGCQ
jgi:RHS repeat-associated protein